MSETEPRYIAAIRGTAIKVLCTWPDGREEQMAIDLRDERTLAKLYAAMSTIAADAATAAAPVAPAAAP